MASKEQRTCQNCSKTFLVYVSEIEKGGGKCCSKQCVYELKTKTSSVIKICLHCGTSFCVRKGIQSFRKADFCSRKCYGEYRSAKVDCKCLICGSNFKRSPSSVSVGGGKYCSNKCRGLSNSKDHHIWWKGGQFYSFGLNWKEQRKIAYARDNGVCQCCGLTESQSLEKYGKRNSIHHIIRRRVFRDRGEPIENANVLSNLVTLCSSCHKSVEGGVITLPSQLVSKP